MNGENMHGQNLLSFGQSLTLAGAKHIMVSLISLTAQSLLV
jgi:hypothetical protein